MANPPHLQCISCNLGSSLPIEIRNLVEILIFLWIRVVELFLTLYIPIYTANTFTVNILHFILWNANNVEVALLRTCPFVFPCWHLILWKSQILKLLIFRKLSQKIFMDEPFPYTSFAWSEWIGGWVLSLSIMRYSDWIAWAIVISRSEGHRFRSVSDWM